MKLGVKSCVWRTSMGLGVGGLVLLISAGGCVSSTVSAPPTVDASVQSPDTGLPLVDGGPTADTGLPGVDSGACPAGWVESGGKCYVSLLGSWAASTDANSDAPDTVATLGAVTATSVSVAQSHTGTDNADCGCNAQHLVIPLGQAFSCATSTLEFSYVTDVAVGALNTPAVDIRFCTDSCPDTTGFYGGQQYVGSPAAPGNSNCAYEWENDAGTASLNYFPASALITSGQTTTVPLGSYAAPSPGQACTGTFNMIDVHLQVYNCSAVQTGTSTLSNLRIY